MEQGFNPREVFRQRIRQEMRTAAPAFEFCDEVVQRRQHQFQELTWKEDSLQLEPLISGAVEASSTDHPMQGIGETAPSGMRGGVC